MSASYAAPPTGRPFLPRDQYGWLVDLINLFGDRDGFRRVREKLENKDNHSAKVGKDDISEQRQRI